MTHVTKYLGYFWQEICWQKLLKNRQIWSHWVGGETFIGSNFWSIHRGMLQKCFKLNLNISLSAVHRDNWWCLGSILWNFCLSKGSFTRSAFDTCGCSRRLRFRRDRIFSISPHCTLLSQPHTSNAACMNEP